MLLDGGRLPGQNGLDLVERSRLLGQQAAEDAEAGVDGAGDLDQPGRAGHG